MRPSYQIRSIYVVIPDLSGNLHSGRCTRPINMFVTLQTPQVVVCAFRLLCVKKGGEPPVAASPFVGSYYDVAYRRRPSSLTIALYLSMSTALR